MLCDGKFSFWKGEIDRKMVVIRVREDDKPAKRWIEKGLPQGLTIHPAGEENVKQWLDGHSEYKLQE